MELDRQPEHPTPQQHSSQKTQARMSFTFIPVEKMYTQEICITMGVALSVIGLIGFVVDNFLSGSPNYTHNAIHLIAGALSLWFGFSSLTSAKRFAWIAGGAYAILGLFGFIFGAPGLPVTGILPQDSFLWKVLPAELELGTVDHTLHLVFAGVFILGAALKFKRYQKI